MNLNEINQEIIAIEFQFSDATSQINAISLLETFKGDKRVTAKSLEYLNIALAKNQELIKLLGKREETLKALLPEVKKESTEEKTNQEPQN